METVNEFAPLFRKDYDKMKEADIQTCIRSYLTSGEFNHEVYHLARSTSQMERRRQSAGSKRWELRGMSAKRSCGREEPETVLPPENESEGKGGADASFTWKSTQLLERHS